MREYPLLDDGSVYTTTNDEEIEPLVITRRVPQGGILSPMLFNVSLLELKKAPSAYF